MWLVHSPPDFPVPLARFRPRFTDWREPLPKEVRGAVGVVALAFFHGGRFTFAAAVVGSCMLLQRCVSPIYCLGMKGAPNCTAPGTQLQPTVITVFDSTTPHCYVRAPFPAVFCTLWCLEGWQLGGCYRWWDDPQPPVLLGTDEVRRLGCCSRRVALFSGVRVAGTPEYISSCEGYPNVTICQCRLVFRMAHTCAEERACIPFVVMTTACLPEGIDFAGLD